MFTNRVEMGKPHERAPEVKRLAASRTDSVKSAPPPPPGEDREYSAEQVEKATMELAERLNMKVELAQDEKTGRQVVRIMSQDGERLVRQMPPDAVIRLADQARRGTLESLMKSVA